MVVNINGIPVHDGFFMDRKGQDMSASYGYEIVVKEKWGKDGELVEGGEAYQLAFHSSGLMEVPTRESVLWANRTKMEAKKLEPKDVEVYISHPFGETPAK